MDILARAWRNEPLRQNSAFRHIWRWLRLNPLLALTALLVISLICYYPVHAWFQSASGPQWQADGLQGTLVHSIALGHHRSGLAFAGAHGGIYRYQTGQGWQQVLGQGEIWSLVLLPDDRTVVAGDNNGDVHISPDSGNHWRNVMVTPQGVYAVSFVPGRPTQLLAGAGGGLYLSLDEGKHWQRRLTLHQSAGAAFSWQPGSSSTVYAGAVAGGPGGSTLVYVSHDAGRTWQPYGRHLQSFSGIMSLLATADAQVYTGTMGNATWRVANSTASWHKAANGMPGSNDHVAALTSPPAHPRTVFAGTLGYGIFRSDDAGRHWQNISGNLPAGHNATTVLSLAYDRFTHTLYAGTADGIYTFKPATSATR